ncbi:CBS domain-containing protein [Arenibacterium sp. CAU 1754]
MIYRRLSHRKRKVPPVLTGLPWVDALTLRPIAAVTKRGREIMIRDIMRKPAVTVSVRESIVSAAVRMRDRNTGFLTVMDTEGMVGVLTVHDIVTRFVAAGTLSKDYPVGDFMSRGIIKCLDMQPVEDAAVIMSDHQIRNLPVCNTEGALVGTLCLDHIAENYSEHLAGETLGEIVERR